MNNLVSVIIPVYNVEKFVLEAIRSIQNQTYKNLEIIVVDDGSVDNTFEIVKSLANQDSRIKVYKNETNLKIVKSLNRALSLANGDFIARMDGDDVSMPNRIEVLLNYLLNNPECSLVGSAYIGINEVGESSGVSAVPTSQSMIDNTLLYSSPVSHIWLAKKEAYDALGGYRADTVEDYDFLLRMKTSGFIFTNIDSILYQVRRRDGNTASTQGLKQEKAFNYVRNLYKERVKTGEDSYSELNFNNAIKSNAVMEKLHNTSQKLLSSALDSKGFKKYFLALLATLSSYYTFSYLLRRTIYKRCLRKES